MKFTIYFSFHLCPWCFSFDISLLKICFLLYTAVVELFNSMANYIFTGIQDFPGNKMNFHPSIINGRTLNSHLSNPTSDGSMRGSNYNSVSQMISSSPIFTQQNVPLGVINGQINPHLTIRPTSSTPNSLRVLTTTSSTVSPSASSSNNFFQSTLPLNQQSVNSVPKMYFHTDSSDTVLFQSWLLETATETFFTCFLFLLLAIILEGIKYYREHLLKQLSFSVKKAVPVVTRINRSSSIYSSIQRCDTAHQHEMQQQQQQHQLHQHQHFHPQHQYTSSHVSGNPTVNHNSQHSATRYNLPSVASQSNSSSTLKCKKLTFANDDFKIRLVSVPHLIQTSLYFVQLIITYVLMMAFMTFNTWICLSIVFGSAIGYWLFYWRKVAIVYCDSDRT